MNQIVQCVPNISEGRDLEKIAFMTEPLKNQKGFKLVSVEPDKDYHRSVITLLGDPKAMIEPLLKFIKRVEQTIDMNKHQGEHSRMGAVDVIPFIPIANIEIEECALYAKQLAEKVAKNYNIPVFLYAQAAQKKSRVSLPKIRKGEFEGMAEKMEDPNWTADFGPATIHKTFGVVAIGARIPLVAYNIDLATTDIKIAKAIAKAIRQSTGGFKFVQAGPVFLDARGHVQVTMNILDYKKNPIYRVYETVKMEAKRYDVKVTGAEIVGLVPKGALLNSLKYYYAVAKLDYDKEMSLEKMTNAAIKHLEFRDFDKDKIIESNI